MSQGHNQFMSFHTGQLLKKVLFNALSLCMADGNSTRKKFFYLHLILIETQRYNLVFNNVGTKEQVETS